jgi:hypothetical protein
VEGGAKVRIVYCTKGHRVEVSSPVLDLDPDGTYSWFDVSLATDRACGGCDACWALITQVKPFKAKRSGES